MAQTVTSMRPRESELLKGPLQSGLRPALNRFNQPENWPTPGHTQLRRYNIVDDEEDATLYAIPPTSGPSGPARRSEVQAAAAAAGNTSFDDDILGHLRENNALIRQPNANAMKAAINT